MVTEVLAAALEGVGWRTETVDCMALLGRLSSRVGDGVFRGLLAMPTLYDGMHFSHFRTGSRLVTVMDRMATRRLVPALGRYLAGRRCDAVVAAFPTGASAMAQLRLPEGKPRPAMIVVCTDVAPHSVWVKPGTDLFMVTSDAAASAVRRHAPGARVAVVPAPVRSGFHRPPSQAQARAEMGIGADQRCVLIMGGGWGLGPLAETARLLAEREMAVLAVAGRNERLSEALVEQARRQPRIRPFGFTDEVPKLMAAADIVLTTAGATTCSEARAVGRPLMLLDVIPGHGRDNIQHELSLGGADVCDPDPERLTEAVSAAMSRYGRADGTVPSRPRFEEELPALLASLGLAGAVTTAPRHGARGNGSGPDELSQEVTL
jgi:UDP-N-acetylglucosamine:LPS N-acetylglucosamine transferase